MLHPVEGVTYLFEGRETVYTFTNIDTETGRADAHWLGGHLSGYYYKRAFENGCYSVKQNVGENV